MKTPDKGLIAFITMLILAAIPIVVTVIHLNN